MSCDSSYGILLRSHLHSPKKNSLTTGRLIDKNLTTGIGRPVVMCFLTILCGKNASSYQTGGTFLPAIALRMYVPPNTYDSVAFRYLNHDGSVNPHEKPSPISTRKRQPHARLHRHGVRAGIVHVVDGLFPT